MFPRRLAGPRPALQAVDDAGRVHARHAGGRGLPRATEGRSRVNVRGYIYERKGHLPGALFVAVVVVPRWCLDAQDAPQTRATMRGADSQGESTRTGSDAKPPFSCASPGSSMLEAGGQICA